MNVFTVQIHYLSLKCVQCLVLIKMNVFNERILLNSFVRDRTVTPRCLGMLRLDWVVKCGRTAQKMVVVIKKYILIYFPGDSFRSTPNQVYTIKKHTFIN